LNPAAPRHIRYESAGFFVFRGAVADLNGGSFPDLLAADAHGKLHFLVNEEGRFREGSMRLPLTDTGAIASLTPAWLANPGKLDLLAMTRSGQFRAFEKEGAPAHWVEVKMSGYKSNSGGIGSVVEFKAGNYYNKVIVTSSPVRVFTGDLTKLDVIRVTWPNAVVQNWIDKATDQQIEVRESERLASSCPFLYTWNGQRFVYVTDVLGVGPLGELGPEIGQQRRRVGGQGIAVEAGVDDDEGREAGKGLAAQGQAFRSPAFDQVEPVAREAAEEPHRPGPVEAG